MPRCKEGCTYSKAIVQSYPRLCTKCRWVQPENVDEGPEGLTAAKDLAELRAKISAMRAALPANSHAWMILSAILEPTT